MTADLSHRLREHGRRCRASGSPLMGALLTGAADDLARAGAVAALLGPHADDPPGSVVGLRFAGALHRLVLERRAPLLALHYPSVGGTAPVEDVWPAARSTVEQHLAELSVLVRLPVQTNEVGRSAVLVGGLARVSGDGLPVRLLELGASAGLNLLADRYALRVQGRLRGPTGSPVLLDEPWEGRVPPEVDVRVVERAGCDPAPVDPRTTEGRLTLTSYVWADQRERFDRLRGALEVAEQVDAPVERAHASAFLADRLGRAVPGVRTVVWQSIVQQYLDPQERADVASRLEEAGARATASSPLVHLALEPERVDAELHRFRLTARTWPGGETEVLAEAQSHGPPVVWR